MTDDKSKRDSRDRDRVAGDEEYEVGYFASKFGLSIPQVRELMESPRRQAERVAALMERRDG